MVLATLSQVGDFAKISYNEALRYVTKLTGYTYVAGGAGSVKLEFRWSTTNQVKTAWIDLNDQNLQDVELDPNNDLWIDFRITLLSGGPITIQSIAVKYEQDPIAQDKFLGYKPIASACQCGNITSLTKIENFSFKPYHVNPAISLFSSLSTSVNQLFGHSVEYARAVPLFVGRDVTLKEWTLFDVDDPCCIKVMVPNNEFPDNKINFGPMGLDFEMPFELHIVKDYFEDVFGIGSAPQKRDIVYFPLTNRIYEVQSAYLFRDFMQKPIYWKVALMKYAPKANRSEPQDLRQKLDSISADTDELFGKILVDDELEKTKPQQYDPKLGSEYDPIRAYINDKLAVLTDNFLNFYTLISNSQYDLDSLFTPGAFTEAIKYRPTVEFAPGSDRAFLAWFKCVKPKAVTYRDQVQSSFTTITISTNYALVQFTIAATRTYAVGDVIKITRPNGIILYGEWVSSPSPGVHRVNIPIGVYNFLQAQYPSWATAGSYHAELSFENFLFWGYDQTAQKGWKLSITVNRFIKLYLNDKVHLFVLPQTLAQNEWYAIFLNISGKYKQISLNVWTRKWKENDATPQNTTDLENIYSIAKTFVPEDYTVTSTEWKNYRLIGTPLILTNLRLFDSIENDADRQMTLLNQNIVEDSQLAIIIDNSIQRLRLPWIGKTK